MSKNRKHYDENLYDEDLKQVEELVEKENEEIETQDVQESTEPETVNGIVCNHPLVNVRKGPSKEHESITTLKEGTAVEILERDGDFYKIKYDGKKVGYIHSDYCRKEA